MAPKLEKSTAKKTPEVDKSSGNKPPEVEKSSTTTSQFIFPTVKSKTIPKPSKFFSPELSSPLPTTSFFTNFVIGNGDQPTFIHPYLIKLSRSSLSLSYPTISSSSSSISQEFSPDFTISADSTSRSSSSHLITSFSDLTVTVDFPSSDLRFLLARGSPYVTLKVSRTTNLPLLFSTQSEIKSISSCKNNKHRIELKSKQIWIVYADSELSLKKVDDTHIRSSKSFSGVVRVAVVPKDGIAKSEEILDKYSTCYAIRGEASISPFSMEYKWKTKGWGKLLMLAHPLHMKLRSDDNNYDMEVLDEFKYESVDGKLVGVIGNKWKLGVEYVSVSWYSKRGISVDKVSEIESALRQDVGALDSTPISTNNIYHYAREVSKAARLALIADEVNCKDVIPAIRKYLKKNIEPWLVGSDEKGFLYDKLWGGVVSKQGITDVSADCGFGLYNNHHVILGYFVFSIAVLAKFDHEWRMKYKREAYALVGSYMSMKTREESKYTKLRCFDVYKLHSWRKHLGNDKPRNSKRPSSSIHAYYAASLLGRVYKDAHLKKVGLTLALFEIEATKTWWHVKERGVYEGFHEFLKKNKVVGTVWECKRDEEKTEHRAAGNQVKPLMPVLSEMLFSDVEFVKDVVSWATSELDGKEASDEWKGLVYALEAMSDNKNALKEIKKLKDFVIWNSMSNMLWWAHSRVGGKNRCSWCSKDAKDCGYCASC